ncbi:uncharacterized protein B0P05DRAFT_540700, partial [Gilbertella persicaria]|uniref:uncharacterized protein n=1 Tax=Gilbertella persicaria TaxID=101096 RepID=UPI00221F3B10
MISSLGQPFSCLIPDVQVEQERLARERQEARQETAQEQQETIARGLKLLEPLEANCIRFFTSSHQYWAYEYCHQQYVRQFHVERTHDGKVEKEQETASFYLGHYPAQPDQSSAPTELKSKGDQRYLVQTWKDGSECDLTERPRTIEVQYHCDVQGQDHVSSFVELSTCHYQIVISTPRLCEEMSLSRRHHTEPHQITCRPIVSEHLLEQDKQKQEQEKLTVEQQKESEVLPLKEEEKEEDLLSMISDLKQQVNQLKQQLDQTKPEVAYFTVDDKGNIIPGVELSQWIGLKEPKPKETKAQEQHQNRQAYHQHYLAV